MRFDVISLFPEMFTPFLQAGVTRRAYSSGQVQVQLWSLRDFTHDPYQRVDDRPFGGGPGMVMLAQPLREAIEAVRAQREDAAPVVLFSPQGEVLKHPLVQRWASSTGAILICGRYEGVDQRLIDALVDVQISLGDFVLSGGEVAAMAMIDAVARLQPGVLGDAQSHAQDSFNPALDGLLDCAHYTRPEVWQGPQGPMAVPEVLLSGHHAHIATHRRQQSLAHTAAARPDVLQAARAQGRLSAADEAWLAAQGGPDHPAL